MPDLNTILQINSGSYAPPPDAAASATPTAPDLSGATVTYQDDTGASKTGVVDSPMHGTGAGGYWLQDGSGVGAHMVKSITPADKKDGDQAEPPHLPDASPASKIAFTQALLASPPGVQPTAAPTAAPGAAPDASGPKPLTGVVANVGAGMNEAIAGTAGLPVDAMTGALNLIPRSINAVAGTSIPTIQNPVGGSQWIKNNVLAPVGANPDNVQAQNSFDRIARGTGAGIAGAVLPMGPAAALAGSASPVVAGVARSLAAPSMASTALAGGVAGATGQGAAEIAPDALKPYVNMAGQIIGGAATGLAGGAINAVARGGQAAIEHATAPMTLNRPVETLGTLADGTPITATAQQQLLAKQQILAASSNPHELLGQSQSAPGEIVPGSQPTLGQQTGDMGILGLERTQETKNGVPFRDRRAEQMGARADALKSLRPEAADPFDVREFFGKTTEQMGAHYEAQITKAQTAAEASIDNLSNGDPMGARNYLEAQLRQVDLANGAAVQAAKARAAEKLEGVGTPSAPNETGAAIRAELLAGRAGAKEIENRLWNAIDPTGTARIDAAPVGEGAKSIIDDMPRLADKMSGKEKGIFDDAQTLTGIDKFAEVTALRKRISDGMQAELQTNGRSESYRRLAILLGRVDGTISGAVERQAQAEVSAGAATESDMLSRMQANAEAERDKYLAAKRENSASGLRVGDGNAQGSGGPASSRPSRNSSGNGSQSSTGGGSSAASGDSGGLAGNVDPELAGRYAAAKQSTRDRASTFDEGPVGAAIAPGQNAGGFSKSDSQVASAFAKPGAKSYDDTQAFLNAVGGRPNAVKLLRDQYASDFLRTARSADGTINPASADRWLKANQDGLRHFPELQEKFADAATAQRTVEDLAEQHQQNLRDYQDSAAKSFIGTDPGNSIRSVMGQADPAQNLRQLMTLTKGSPAAQQSIKSNMVAWLTDKAKGAENISTLLQDPKVVRAFNTVLAPDEMKILRGAADAFEDAKALIGDHQAAAKTFADGPAKYFKDTDPQASIERVMGSKDPAAAFRDLMTMTKESPIAQEALRAATADWIKRKVTTSSEVGTSGVRELSNAGLQDIAGNPKLLRGLSEVMTPEQIQTIKDVAADSARSSRSITSTKLAGSPGTAQDLTSVKQGSHSPSIASQVIATEVGGDVLAHFGGPLVKIGGLVAGAVANSARQAGLKKVDDLVTYAVLHPEIGQTLLAKAPADTKVPIMQKLIGQFGDVAISAAQHDINPGPQRKN